MTYIQFLQARLAEQPADDPTAQAHRAIVDLYLDEAASAGVAVGLNAPGEARLYALADVCQLLAHAYADHPDWREDWRLDVTRR